MTRTGHPHSDGTGPVRARSVCPFPIVSLDSQKHKVLRILQAGQFNPPHLTRINKDSLGVPWQ